MSVDFSRAVHWHLAWLKDILGKIDSPHTFKPEEIARDDLCEIGQWLLSIEPIHRDLSEYIELRMLHAELHQLTSDAVKLAQAGKNKEAKQFLSVSGECTVKSKQFLDCAGRFIQKVY